MGMRINTNVLSLSAHRALVDTNNKLSQNLRKLSTGKRITRAGDDAAGLAISERLKAQIRGMGQAKRNTSDAVSLIQTAEGGLNEVSNIVIRLRELSVQAASDTIGHTERELADIEFQQLKKEINRIAYSTEFNGTRLLDGTSGMLEFQIGYRNDPQLDRLRYDGAFTDVTLDTLGLVSEHVGSKQAAQTSLQSLDDALVQINGIRAELGAIQNRLFSVINNISIGHENLSAARSRISDVDMAKETADYTKNKILVESGMAILGQANQYPRIILNLLK